jgi:Ca2+-binding EF-hand superfamily protein
MNKVFPILGVLAFGMVPMVHATLSAQPSPESLAKIAEMMTEADLNGDGKTTRAELNQHRAQMFGKLDRNEDGVIDKQDSPKIPLAKRKFEPAFEQVKSIFDSNEDGRVTLDEWNRSDPDIFALLDSNEDGAVTRSELPTPK